MEELRELGAMASRGAELSSAASRGKRKQQTEPARTAKKLKKLESRVETLQGHKKETVKCLQACVLAIPDAGRVLGVRGVSKGEDNVLVRMWAMQRLAFQPTKHDKDSCKTQNIAAALVASCIKDLQKRRLNNVIDMASKLTSSLRAVEQRRHWTFMGYRLMWDEAAQKLRPLLSAADRKRVDQSLKSQAIVQVFAAACKMFLQKSWQSEYGAVAVECRWEPWTVPCYMLSNTKTNSIIEAVLRAVPISWTTEQMASFVDATDFTLIWLVFDSVVTNLNTVRYLLQSSLTFPPSMAIVPIYCLVHQVHIIKVAAMMG